MQTSLSNCSKMARAKGKQSTRSVPNKHIHARASYLYQAATYMASHGMVQSNVEYNNERALDCSAPQNDSNHSSPSKDPHNYPSDMAMQHIEQHALAAGEPNAATRSTSAQRRLVFHLRGVAQKGQIRLAPSLKRSYCKRCDTLLVPGSTSTSKLDNSSRKGAKPCADLLVIHCLSCGAEKRYPTAAKRQTPKAQRLKDSTILQEPGRTGGS